MISTDLQLDDVGDILLKNGDYVMGESDDQHIEDILDAYPGEYRNAPMLGVYIQRGINGLLDGSIRRDINIHLQSDQYKVRKLEINGEKISINAERNG